MSNSKKAQMNKIVFDILEKIVGKGANTLNKHFLLFSKGFQRASSSKRSVHYDEGLDYSLKQSKGCAIDGCQPTNKRPICENLMGHRCFSWSKRAQLCPQHFGFTCLFW